MSSQNGQTGHFLHVMKKISHDVFSTVITYCPLERCRGGKRKLEAQIISNHPSSHHFMPFHAIPCRFMPFHAVPCRFMRFVIHLQGCSTAKTEAGLDQVMTTNHPEKLDPALIRPGRINKRIHLGFVDAETLLKMLVGQVRIEILMDILDGWHGLGVNSLCRFLLNPTWFLVCGCRVKVASCYIPMFWLFGSATLCCWLSYQVGICSVGHAHIWLVIMYTFHYFPSQQLG